MSLQLLAEPLSIYLNDHLTGAFGGTALAHRMADTHPDSRRAADLRQLARDVEQDRDDLVRIMNSLAVPVRHYRTWLGLAGERIGRLKPNGTLARRSPLSDLIELEAMRTGVEGKTALWRALRSIAETDPRLSAEELDRLIQRAAEQARTLNGWHQAISAEILSGKGATSGASTGSTAHSTAL
ncbi:hypothetical protein OG455_37015 [Kitasatospora sp. NBC_01287]|uniref:hypothetical protein n=1 Tax=Kitasatospora sp. NBC_01287 TaxID=2903573 RepID=UPI002251742A|nr:hypothetical protein [Kitasatospora sp. NBC_01287]MCX4751042.1 hypothetical protein [Kitasatospora sp. NBC_01287]